MAQCGQLVVVPEDLQVPCGSRGRHYAPWWPQRGAAALAGCLGQDHVGTWSRTTPAPAASSAEALPGVSPTPQTFPKVVTPSFLPDFSLSGLGPPSSGQDWWTLGGQYAGLLQTPSSTHNQPFLGWRPLLFLSGPPPSPDAPQDLPGHIPRGEGANRLPSGKPAPAQGNPPHKISGKGWI